MVGNAKLPRIKQKIYDCLKRRPSTRDEIIAYVWQDHPQDAPTNIQTIANHISQLRVILAGFAIILCSQGGSHRRGLQKYYLFEGRDMYKNAKLRRHLENGP